MMVVPESVKTKRKRVYVSKTNKSNVPTPLLTELQAAISFVCYDSPELLCGHTSMTEAQQYKKMSEMFRGEGVEDNPNNMCLVDQFLHGLDRFQGLFTTSIVDIQPGVVPHRKGPPGILLTLIPVLHQKG